MNLESDQSSIQEISAQSGVAFNLKEGQLLKVIDPNGKQVSDLFCFSAQDPKEHFSSGRTLDYADTIFITKGHQLYSNRSQVMMTLVEDQCGRHDLLMTPCSLEMFQIVSGKKDHHPSCQENLAKNLRPFGIGADQLSTTFNIFMNVEVREDGRIRIQPPRSKAGNFLVLRAEMDLIVGLTACSHEETNAGACKPIHYQIL